MATRPKAVIESRNGEKFSPITIAKNILTDDGQNLHDILSDRKEDMMTPTIENSSSMFKVGQGDNVDYSSNVVNSAYESMVLKGKTMVNLLTKTIDTTWNLNLENWSIMTTTLSDCVLKPNTTYSVIVYVTEKTCPDINDLFWVGDIDGKKDKVTHDIVRKNVSLGANVFVINTVPDFSSVTSTHRGGINFQGSKFVEGTLKWKAIILEGDWTNKELPPYFTGLCDVKMPILRNVGKNLLCIQDYSPKGTITNVEVTQNTLKATAEGMWHGFEYILQLKPNTEYTFSFERDSDTIKGFIRHPENKGWTGGYGGYSNYTFTTRSTGVIRFTIESSLANNTIIVRNPMIVEGNLHPISYENYKINVLRTSEEIVLRSLPNGVCDTLNVETGEYVQRIGEVVLDGSNDENIGIFTTKDEPVKTSAFYFLSDSLGTNNNAYSQTYISNSLNFNDVYTTDLECFNIHENRIRFRFLKEKATTIDECRTYLASNPITVQYQLATPIVSTVDIQGFPYAYTNGHVQLSSGHNRQSLTPKVEYSVITNQNGQIRSNQKMVERQQKQLDRLQAMILTNLVNTQYEQTLTNLKYDLKNVREEVK